MEYNPGGSVERTVSELIKSGAIKVPAGTVPPPVSGVTPPAPVVPVGPAPAPGAPGVPAQPGAVDALGHPVPPAPVAKPKTGEMVQGETGLNGEPLFYVMHDGIESKLTVDEMAKDHSYKSHNTRVGQENAELRRELDLRETQLLARETTIAASGAASFDALLNGAPGAAASAPVTVVPPVVVPPVPAVELAVENPDEYARLVAVREQAVSAHNDATIAASVKSAVDPLVAQMAETTKAQENATKQADLKVRQEQQMIDLRGKIPELDMNLVVDFLARSSHEDAARFNNPEGYEFVWGKITRGEQPGGVTPVAPVVPVPGYTPPPIANSATPPVALPPFAEPGAGGGRVAHAAPAVPAGGALPNMTTPEAIAQALKDKRAATGPRIYVPHAVAR